MAEVVAPVASVSVIKILLVPVLVGVPESSPPELRLRPAGNAELVHWKGAVPPDSVNVSGL